MIRDLRECYRIRDSSVSRYHAEIRWKERRWQVRDLGSTNGTLSNGVILGNGYWPLRERDVLQFGQVALVVLSLAPTALEMLASSRTMERPTVRFLASPPFRAWKCHSSLSLRCAAREPMG